MAKDLEQFAAELQTKQAERRKAAHSAPWIPTATAASSIGYKCERRILYQRMQPQDAAPPNAELSSIFDEGNLHHKAVRAELADLGYEVVDGETQFFDERLDLRGHIDGRIRILGRRVPVEIKSMMGQGPRTQADWASRDGIMGRYYDQLQIYLFLTSCQDGLGLFKDKATGLWTVCAVDLDYAHAEKLVQKAERLRDAFKMKVLPDRLLDRSECPGCPFALTCLPGDAHVDPLLLANDDQLQDDMATRESLRKAAGDFDKLDERIKERFKMTAGSRFVLGRFLITKKPHGKGIRIVTEVLEDTVAAQGVQA